MGLLTTMVAVVAAGVVEAVAAAVTVLLDRSLATPTGSASM